MPKGSAVVPIGSAQLVALNVRGEEVKQIAAYLPRIGKWFPIDLKVSAKDGASPVVANGLASYLIGPRVYAFSASAARWDTLSGGWRHRDPSHAGTRQSKRAPVAMPRSLRGEFW